MFVFSTFICISIFNRFVKSSRYFIVFEYNAMSFLIELFRVMIITINVFEMFIVAINLIKMRDFKSEFITIKN